MTKEQQARITKKCSGCDGTGKIFMTDDHTTVVIDVPCAMCGGTGKIYDFSKLDSRPKKKIPIIYG